MSGRAGRGTAAAGRASVAAAHAAGNSGPGSASYSRRGGSSSSSAATIAGARAAVISSAAQAAAAARGLSSATPVTASDGTSSFYSSITQPNETLTPYEQAIVNSVDQYYANDQEQLQKLHDLATQNYKDALNKVLTENADTLAKDTQAQDTNTSDNLSNAWAAMFGEKGVGEEVGDGDGEAVNIANAAVRARDTAVAQEKKTIDARNANAQNDYNYNVANEDIGSARNIAANQSTGALVRQQTISELLGRNAGTNNLQNENSFLDTNNTSSANDPTAAYRRAIGNTTTNPGYKSPLITAKTPEGIQAQQFAAGRAATLSAY